MVAGGVGMVHQMYHELEWAGVLVKSGRLG